MTQTIISADPDIQGGRPCFKGTRIPVTSVWEFALEGWDAQRIHDEAYPLPIEQIQAAIDMVEWIGRPDR